MGAQDDDEAVPLLLVCLAAKAMLVLSLQNGLDFISWQILDLISWQILNKVQVN
jgi:hypothetical protein